MSVYNESAALHWPRPQLTPRDKGHMLVSYQAQRELQQKIVIHLEMKSLFALLFLAGVAVVTAQIPQRCSKSIP